MNIDSSNYTRIGFNFLDVLMNSFRLRLRDGMCVPVGGFATVQIVTQVVFSDGVYSVTNFGKSWKIPIEINTYAPTKYPRFIADYSCI